MYRPDRCVSLLLSETVKLNASKFLYKRQPEVFKMRIFLTVFARHSILTDKHVMEEGLEERFLKIFYIQGAFSILT